MGTEPKPTVIGKKASSGSLNSTTANSAFKSSAPVQAGKPRALLAAERKKEADDRQAQRKQDLKREAERKRAAQQEETRRQEQRHRAESERKERERIAAEQAKKMAQQQAIEKRRQDQMRKLEQQRSAAAAHDLVSWSSDPSHGWSEWKPAKIITDHITDFTSTSFHCTTTTIRSGSLETAVKVRGHVGSKQIPSRSQPSHQSSQTSETTS